MMIVWKKPIRLHPWGKNVCCKKWTIFDFFRMWNNCNAEHTSHKINAYTISKYIYITEHKDSECRTELWTEKKKAMAQ